MDGYTTYGRVYERQLCLRETLIWFNLTIVKLCHWFAKNTSSSKKISITYREYIIQMNYIPSLRKQISFCFSFPGLFSHAIILYTNISYDNNKIHFSSNEILLRYFQDGVILLQLYQNALRIFLRAILETFAPKCIT